MLKSTCCTLAVVIVVSRLETKEIFYRDVLCSNFLTKVVHNKCYYYIFYVIFFYLIPSILLFCLYGGDWWCDLPFTDTGDWFRYDIPITNKIDDDARDALSNLTPLLLAYTPFRWTHPLICSSTSVFRGLRSWFRSMTTTMTSHNPLPFGFCMFVTRCSTRFSW